MVEYVERSGRRQTGKGLSVWEGVISLGTNIKKKMYESYEKYFLPCLPFII